MRIAIVQMNPVVGDVGGNMDRMWDVAVDLAMVEPDLIVFSELCLTGYPPRDLLLRSSFREHTQRAVDELAAATKRLRNVGILLGAPLPTGKESGTGLHNCGVLLHDGEVRATQPKSLLPEYDVFDERRYFDPAEDVGPIAFKGEMLGVSVCEDAWNAPELWPMDRVYAFDPIAKLAEQGATLLINLSASPFYAGKHAVRYRLLSAHARKHGLPLVYVNQVGANDELIFDGHSLVLDAEGRPVDALAAFDEDVFVFDTSWRAEGEYQPPDKIGSVLDALTLGTLDYLRKCKFSRAVIGLSGGIDSSVTCAIAVRALGSDNVLGVTMPGPYSSEGSVDDSRALADNLGIELRVIPITDTYEAYLDTMSDTLDRGTPTTAEENIQARIRGNILMAISNKLGHLVLSTGNKSELAVGYCTLYGDMSGGISVLGDVPKTMVYELAEYLNREEPVIPRSVIEKPPSAELKPDQKDEDTLPPYEVLDRIIELYVERQWSPGRIIEEGIDAEAVEWATRAIDSNEYKRRQAPPILKVTSRAFGTGRRMPIAAVTHLGREVGGRG